jgi:hypothetical protein
MMEDRMPKMLMALLMGLMMIAGSPAFAETVDFEDFTLDPDSYYNGDDNAGGFESGGVNFNNLYDDTYGPYWEGFAYSSMRDTTTLDYTNQYSAIPGSGANGSDTYAMAYLGFYGIIPTITFSEEVPMRSAEITNSTYAFLSMKEGYAVAKKFGGASGDDKDWFLLTITGKDGEGNVTGTVEFYLADYRFEDNSRDYIIDQWTSVDLSDLGLVKTLEFSLSSSDNDPVYGMNTPAYFSIDNVVYNSTDDDDNQFPGCFITHLQ